jgi:predicted NBD/HSP70 family sugar kinase
MAMTNTSSLKKSNLLRIVQTIKALGPVSKPDIATATGLTGASVHNLVKELEGKGLVKEIGLSSSSGGRKASLYTFNSSCFYLIGFTATLNTMSTALYDLDFTTLYHNDVDFSLNGNSVESGITTMVEEVRKAVEVAAGMPGALLGVGVSVPGLVDYEKGVVIRLTNAPRWKNVPVRDILKRELGQSAVVDKDTNAALLHIRQTRTQASPVNAVFLSISHGIGAGLYLNGGIFRSNHGLAGEVGHLSVDSEGKLCNCGNRGCLELYISNRALYEKAKAILPSLDREMNCTDNCIETIAAAMEADGVAPMTLYEEASDRLARCIGDTIRMYDPDEVIIECAWLRRYEEIYLKLCASVFDNNNLIDRSAVTISLNTVEDIWVKGAASLVYDRQFSDYTSELMGFSSDSGEA